ncbi:MAG: STAS domain-containing protein [Acidobacteriota bacterium]
MEIEVRSENEVTVVVIRGSVDGLTAEDLTSSLSSLIQAGQEKLVADFADVDYTSSAGLRALLATVKESRQRGGDIRLSAVRPEVMRVLQLSGFSNILKLYGDVRAAIASYAA